MHSLALHDAFPRHFINRILQHRRSAQLKQRQVLVAALGKARKTKKTLVFDDGDEKARSVIVDFSISPLIRCFCFIVVKAK